MNSARGRRNETPDSLRSPALWTAAVLYALLAGPVHPMSPDEFMVLQRAAPIPLEWYYEDPGIQFNGGTELIVLGRQTPLHIMMRQPVTGYLYLKVRSGAKLGHGREYLYPNLQYEVFVNRRPIKMRPLEFPPIEETKVVGDNGQPYGVFSGWLRSEVPWQFPANSIITIRCGLDWWHVFQVNVTPQLYDRTWLSKEAPRTDQRTTQKQTVPTPPPSINTIRWYQSYNEARNASRTQGKPLLLYFRDNSRESRSLEQNILRGQRFQEKAAKCICLFADQSAVTETGRKMFQIDKYPTIIIQDAQGNELARLSGDIAESQLLLALGLFTK